MNDAKSIRAGMAREEAVAEVEPKQIRVCWLVERCPMAPRSTCQLCQGGPKSLAGEFPGFFRAASPRWSAG